MVKIRWLGHAAFEIRLAGRIILVDPWLDGNPKAAIKTSDVEEVDVVCVTHDHVDHIGSAFEICEKTGATFVGTPELSSYAKESGVKEVVGFNIGGAASVKGIDMMMTQAFHTAARGVSTGFVLKAEEMGIYHAGDTGLFGDMNFIGELYAPDAALLPIGGYYTMNSREAAEAVRLIKPKVVIPMHYQTFPVLVKTADEFVKKVNEKSPEVKVVVLVQGEAYSL